MRIALRSLDRIRSAAAPTGPAERIAARPHAGPVTSLPGTGAARPLDLDAVYRAHASEVSRWARRLLGPRGDVEDVVHEVFLIAHRRRAEWRGEAKVTTWLYAITVRIVQERRRRARLLAWLRTAFGGDPDASDAPATPLQALESRRAAEVTYKILDTLPERDRSALILFELEGLTGEEIAAITGDKVGALWVRLHRARARFRAAFARLEEEGLRRPDDAVGCGEEEGA